MTWITLKNPLFSSGPDDEFARFHWDYTSAVPPGELFHYTTAENLTNIIKFGNLWATECTFLNDSEEMLSGMKIFTEAVECFTDFAFRDLVKSALVLWNDNSWMSFVISLSEHGDLLSQWRTYAHDGTGCAIAFDAECIRSRAGFGEFVGLDPDKLPKDTSNFYHLLKVVYKIEEKRKIAKEFLRIAHDQYQVLGLSHSDATSENMKVFVLLCALRLKEFLISFKNEEFSEEREWRIVSSLHRDDSAIEFRQTNYGIAPYTRTNLSPKDKIFSSRLPIKKIVLGPRNLTKSNQKGLSLFLKRMSCDAHISASQSSYR